MVVWRHLGYTRICPPRSDPSHFYRNYFTLTFSGNIAQERATKEYWQTLRTHAAKLMNPEQLAFSDYLFQSIIAATTKGNALKDIRDALIHSLSHRPAGVVPADNSSSSSLPKTVHELYQLVLSERSHVREALLLMAIIIRAKTPVNNKITKSYI